MTFTITLTPAGSCQQPVQVWVSDDVDNYTTTITLYNGTGTYQPQAVLPAGTHTVAAVYTGINAWGQTSGCAPSGQTITQTVNKLTPAIEISNIPSSAVYGGSFTVTYNYASSLFPTESVTSATPGVCTTSGNVVSFVGVGTCSLNASVTAATNYNAATGRTQSFTVGQGTATISISNIPSPSNAVYGNSFTATYNYTGNGAPTETVAATPSNVCTASGSTVSFVGVGTCTLTASATATTDDKATTGSAQSFTVWQATPTISISNIPSSAVYGSSLAVTYSYSGNGSPSVSSSTTGVCTISGNAVSFVGVGTCTLTASATETTNDKATTGSAQSFAVVPATPTVSISNIPSNAVYGGSFTPTFSYSGSGSPTETVTSNTTGLCMVSGGTVTFVGGGTCSLYASAGATTDYVRVDGSVQSFNVSTLTPTISITNPPTNAVTGGSFTATYNYSGNGSPTETVTSTTPSICTTSGSTVTFVGGGDYCSLQASASATADYKEVTGVTQSFYVTIWDSGTVALTVSNGSGGTLFSQSTSYREGATPESIAAGLVGTNSNVTVTAVGDTLYIEAAGAGASSDYYYVVTPSWNRFFNNPSFTSSPASGNLVGGANASSSQPTIYSYAASYDGVGNVTGYTDSVMGTWGFGYDTLNRLMTGQATSTTSATSGYANQYLCWSYDSFGNRTAESLQSSACSSGVTATARYNSNNQVSWTAVKSAVNGFTYDAAGNVISDSVNLYLYDGDGRVCAVKSTPVGGSTTMTGYVYDAEGNRVAKGTLSWTGSGKPAWNTACSGISGQGGWTFATTSDYILGPSGEQVTEMAQNSNGSMEAQHVNAWTSGKLLATYDPNGLHFYLDDPLGSRRVQTDFAGVVEQNCTNLPFGDGESCAPTPTEHLFTGKERDAESGNDYFGARYYSSAMGRWLSPDKPLADQHTSNPQSWNLYEYGRNNPLRNIDPNGFKVLQAVVVEAVSKINALPGGTLYLDFAGIQGLHGHPSLNASTNFNGWHSDHFSTNSVVIPNNGIVSGFFRAFFGLANKDQADTGKAIVAAAKSSGQDVAFDTYSNGVNAAGKVAQGMSVGDLQSATVVGPDANSPAAVQAMDQADLNSTQIYISSFDPALALAWFGSQSIDDWIAQFGDASEGGRVHVTDQPSHNLNQYRNAQNPGFCPAEYQSCD